jgi:peptidoglycan hydrolase-like protein with peptidoglycan-binding domain
LLLSARRAFVAGVILLIAAGQSPAQTTTKASSPSSKQHSSAKSKGRRHARKGAWKRHGQKAIQPERARAIQEALIREHYLTGEPTGVWDARSKEAMARFQADHGWQSKVTPDSRALIKLGLGPSYSDKELYRATSDASRTPANPTAGAVPSRQ